MPLLLPTLDDVRYEILPFGSAEAQAGALSAPRTLTVTCSPKQGVDHTVDIACRLRALGHTVIVHIAARMVRGPQHLDELLARMAAHDIADIFLIGGDAAEPLGPYASAAELLPLLRASAHAPRTIGVAAYPEGHPLIAGDLLAATLREKDGIADYMTTQLCFDGDALLRWLEQTREAGIELPLYVGLPGIVDRKRLLEISLRVGVGASVSFLRKQRGIRNLVGRRADETQKLYSTVAPLIGGSLGITGLHFFTFNGLVDTVGFVERQQHREPHEHAESAASHRPSDRSLGVL